MLNFRHVDATEMTPSHMHQIKQNKLPKYTKKMKGCAIFKENVPRGFNLENACWVVNEIFIFVFRATDKVSRKHDLAFSYKQAAKFHNLFACIFFSSPHPKTTLLLILIDQKILNTQKTWKKKRPRKSSLGKINMTYHCTVV